MRPSGANLSLTTRDNRKPAEEMSFPELVMYCLNNTTPDENRIEVTLSDVHELAKRAYPLHDFHTLVMTQGETILSVEETARRLEGVIANHRTLLKALSIHGLFESVVTNPLGASINTEMWEKEQFLLKEKMEEAHNHALLIA